VNRPLKEEPWIEDAKCKGMPPTIFFPKTHTGRPFAIAICNQCPVQVQCLEYALERQGTNNSSFPGIWGGTTERQRIMIVKRRRYASRISKG